MRDFDFANDLAVRARNLPHWRQHGVTYFVTFRLADALPAERVKLLETERKCWERLHKPPYSPEERYERKRLFTQRVQRWLDAGHGRCLLRRPHFALLMTHTVTHFEEERYRLDRWTVAANHCPVRG